MAYGILLDGVAQPAQKTKTGRQRHRHRPGIGTAADAGNGDILCIPKAKPLKTRQGAQEVPVPAEENEYMAPQPGLGGGYHIYQYRADTYVFDGDNRLVQQVHSRLGTLGDT